MNNIASRVQFKPIKIGENLVVNYNVQWNTTTGRLKNTLSNTVMICHISFSRLTNLMLHQCIEEHKYSVIGKHARDHAVETTDMMKIISVSK